MDGISGSLSALATDVSAGGVTAGVQVKVLDKALEMAQAEAQALIEELGQSVDVFA